MGGGGPKSTLTVYFGYRKIGLRVQVVVGGVKTGCVQMIWIERFSVVTD